MTVSAGLFDTYPPESYLPRFSYFPLFLKPTPHVITLDEVQTEIDSTGRASIIHLIDKNDKPIIPFIDLSKFDQDTKGWYIYNETDRLPYRFILTDATSGIYNMYPSELGTITDFTIDRIYFDSSLEELILSVKEGINNYNFYMYSPIVLVSENVPYTDLTDYVNLTVDRERLSRTSSTFEFYYDFEERIFTNQNLTGFNSKDVKIAFQTIGDNSVTVKCRMGSNSGNRPKVTPVIDDYILKLRGQYLRS